MMDGAQLVRRIVYGRRGAFRLDGKWLRPGRVIPQDSLWPATDWPSVPHVIEIFPSSTSVGGHGGSRVDVILWRFVQGEWRDACTLRGHDSAAWMPEIEPVLSRSLSQARAHVPLPNMRTIAARILASVDREMSELDTEQQRAFLMTEIWLGLGWRECELQDSVFEDQDSLG